MWGSLVACDNVHKGYSAASLLGPVDCAGLWLAEKSAVPAGAKGASFIVELPHASPVESMYVRNAGSEFVEVDALCEGENSWLCLLQNAMLLPPVLDHFTGRYFKDTHFNKLLASKNISRLRVTVSSPLAYFGLCSFHINVSPEDLELLRSLDTQSARETLTAELQTLLGEQRGGFSPVSVALTGAKAKMAGNKAEDSKKKKKVAKKKKVEDEEVEEGDDIGDDDEEDDDDDDDDVPKKVSKKTVLKSKRYPNFVFSRLSDEHWSSKSVAPPSKKSKTVAFSQQIFDVNDEVEVAHDELPVLSGVVFAISGLQNPERSKIRDMATGMGAVYKENWSKDCTHLVAVCAGTPKHKTMEQSGKGIAVHFSWIESCFKNKARVSEEEFDFGKKTKSAYNTPTRTLSGSKTSTPATFPDDDNDVELVEENTSYSLLPRFLEPVHALVLMEGESPKALARVKRLLIAYGGQVEEMCTPSVNMVVVPDKTVGVVAAPTNARQVKAQFLEQCHAAQALLPYK